jgi:hypothetical protein
MTISWNDLFTKGTLINFSTHLWRARIQLTPEDLGIDKTEEVVKAISFGCHRLAPAKAFEQINSIVRTWLISIEEHSLAFPLIKGVRFVPDTQIVELQEKLETYQRYFNQAVLDFLDDYSNMQDEMIPVIKTALNDAAKNQEAAEMAIDRIIAEYPSAKKVASKFGLEWNFFNITLPVSDEAVKTAKSATPLIKETLESMILELRRELSDKVSNLITLATKAKSGQSRSKEGLGQKSIRSALAVLDKVARLNVLNDPLLEQQTNVLKQLLENPSDIGYIANELISVKNSLEEDVEKATTRAEQKLTGMGNRRIKLD